MNIVIYMIRHFVVSCLVFYSISTGHSLALESGKVEYLVGEPLTLRVHITKPVVDVAGVNEFADRFWRVKYRRVGEEEGYMLNSWSTVYPSAKSNVGFALGKDGTVLLTLSLFGVPKYIEGESESLVPWDPLVGESADVLPVVFHEKGEYEFTVLYRDGDFSIYLPVLSSEPLRIKVSDPVGIDRAAWGLVKKELDQRSWFLEQDPERSGMFELFNEYTDTVYAKSIWRHFKSGLAPGYESASALEWFDVVWDSFPQDVIESLDSSLLEDRLFPDSAGEGRRVYYGWFRSVRPEEGSGEPIQISGSEIPSDRKDSALFVGSSTDELKIEAVNQDNYTGVVGFLRVLVYSLFCVLLAGIVFLVWRKIVR